MLRCVEQQECAHVLNIQQKSRRILSWGKRLDVPDGFWNAKVEKAFNAVRLMQFKECHPMHCQVRQAILATIFALTAAAALSSSPAAAQRRIQDQFCLQGRIWGYPGNCQFSSYRQCMASASGTDAYCGINPRYAFTDQRPDGYRGRY
jgi:uncharacterized protein DUF3551